MKIGEALDLSMPWCRDLEEPHLEYRNATPPIKEPGYENPQKSLAWKDKWIEIGVS